MAIFAPSTARSGKEREKWRRAVMRFAAFVMSKVETNKRNNTRKKRERNSICGANLKLLLQSQLISATSFRLSNALEFVRAQSENVGRMSVCLSPGPQTKQRFEFRSADRPTHDRQFDTVSQSQWLRRRHEYREGQGAMLLSALNGYVLVTATDQPTNQIKARPCSAPWEAIQ